MSAKETTLIEGYVNCNNCGASALKNTPLEHHDTCRPGEAAKWERYYEEAEPEETCHAAS